MKRKEVGPALAFTQIGENSTLTVLKSWHKKLPHHLERSRYISRGLTRCSGPAGKQQTDLLRKNRRCLVVTLFYPSALDRLHIPRSANISLSGGISISRFLIFAGPYIEYFSTSHHPPYPDGDDDEEIKRRVRENGANGDNDNYCSIFLQSSASSSLRLRDFGKEIAGSKVPGGQHQTLARISRFPTSYHCC